MSELSRSKPPPPLTLTWRLSPCFTALSFAALSMRGIIGLGGGMVPGSEARRKQAGDEYRAAAARARLAAGPMRPLLACCAPAQQGLRQRGGPGHARDSLELINPITPPWS